MKRIIITILIAVLCLSSCSLNSGNLTKSAEDHLEHYLLNDYKSILEYCAFNMHEVLNDNYYDWLDAHQGQNYEWENDYGNNLKCEVEITEIVELEGNDYTKQYEHISNIIDIYEEACLIDSEDVTSICNVYFNFSISGDKDGFQGNHNRYFYKANGKWYTNDLITSTGGFS